MRPKGRQRPCSHTDGENQKPAADLRLQVLGLNQLRDWGLGLPPRM